MKKNYFLFIALSIFSFSFSQTITTIDRPNIIGPTATDNISSVSSVGLTRGSGIALSNTDTNFTSNGWTIGGDLVTAQTNNDYMEWSVTASTGFEITLDELDIALRRSLNGPGNWQLLYSLDGFTTPGVDISGIQTIAPSTSTNYNFPSLGVLSGVSGTITFRLYAWGSSVSTGILRVLPTPSWSISGAVPSPGLRLIGSATTTATNSIESDIISSTIPALFGSVQQNIDYSEYLTASGLDVSNSVPLGAFTIRDGGATAADSDIDGTTLNSIEFEVTNSENIAALALLDLGSFSFVSEVTSVADFTTFSGLNLTASDDSDRQFIIYASFKSIVTDNQQIQLEVNSVTTPATGSSLFAAANAGGAETSTVGDDNRIEVTGNQFVFNQQPTDNNQGEIMVPFPTITAVDSNLNQDLDLNAVDGVTLSTGSSIVAENYDIINGEATLNNIVFTDTETNISLVANAGGLSGTSDTFNIGGPLVNIAQQNFDSEISWTYTTSILPFGTVADWGNTTGYFGEIALANAAPLDNPLFSNEIFGENDLNDVGNPFAILTFADIDVSAFTDLKIQFDWQVVLYANNANDLEYRLVFNGSTAGNPWVSIFDGNGTSSINDGQGRVKIDIPDGNSTIGLQIRLRNERADGYSGLDNFRLVSEFSGLIYTDVDGWVGNDEPDATTGSLDALIVDGTYNLSGNVQVNNFLLNPGATTIIPVSQSLTVNGDLINNGNLELNSASNTYSSLIVNGNSTGEVTYKRHVNQFANTGSSTGANDLISAPVTSPSQDFLALRTANSVIPSGTIGGVPSFLFGPYDNNFNAYINYTAANDTDPVESGVGYRTASTTTGGSTFTFVGNVETNQSPIPITVGSSNDFNLVGNPYPSYISLSGFLAANNSEFGIENAGVYGYDGSATDGFTVWNQGYSDSNPGSVISPGQGFLVTSKVGGGSISFPPSIRTIGTSDDFIIGRNTNEIPLNAYLYLQINNSEQSFKTDFYFNENASLGMDPGYDAVIFNSIAPDFSIYSHLVQENNGKAMAVQSVSYDSMNDVIIPLGINAHQGEQLTISISDNNLPADVNVYLEDNITNTFTLLNANEYKFTPSADLSETGRFFLRFSRNALSTNENDFNSLEIFTTTSPKEIVIRGQLNSDTTLNLYDIQGRVVKSQKLNQNAISQTIDVTDLGSGIYIVQLENENQNRTQKVILK